MYACRLVPDLPTLGMAAVGVDACNKGWIAVALRPGRRVEAHFLPHIASLNTAIPDARAVAIDIPIGLPESNRRAADVAARALLRDRRNSVFFTPVRASLEAATHAEATAISQRLTASGISQQSYALRAKIFEVEQWLPAAPCGVWEVHPEVCFALLLGRPARGSKKTWAGMVERWEAITSSGIQLADVSGAATTQASVDDMLDAAGAAWTAQRLLDGAARSFPEPPEADSLGRAIRDLGLTLVPFAHVFVRFLRGAYFGVLGRSSLATGGGDSVRGTRRARNAFLVLLMAGPLATGGAIVSERAAGAAVTQYGDPTIAYPTSVASGPDGALWFTNNMNSSIGRVTTAGVISNFVHPTISKPTAIASGSDGAMWFTNNGNDSIGRVTTDGVVTNYTDASIVKPIDITSGPAGSLWFTNYNNTIARISTAGVVTNYTNASVSNPTSIFLGPDGALWFTNFNSNSIGRITTSGMITNYPNASGGPNNITAGPDGAMWFTNHRNHAIGRITMGGIISHYSAPGIDSPYSITAGPDGAMWFTNNGHHSIGRITTKGSVSHYTDAEIVIPLGITTGPDGALWFDNVGNNSIGRITTDTLPATVPDEPTAISAAQSGPTGLSVSFVPGFNGGAAVSMYTATCSALDDEPSGTAFGSGSPIVVTGLTSLHPYQCIVTATNLVGTSVASEPSNVIWPGATGTGCGMPSAPTTLTTAPGNGSAVVSWAPAVSGCVAGYIVTPYLGSVQQMATLIPGQGTTTVIPGLVNGSTYRFTVTAENGTIAGSASVMSGPVTVGTPTAATALKLSKVANGRDQGRVQGVAQ